VGDGAILLLLLFALPLVLAPTFAIVGGFFGGLAGLASSIHLSPQERASLEQALVSSDLSGLVRDRLTEVLGASEAIVLSEEGTSNAILEVGAPGVVLWGATGKEAPLHLTVLLPVRLLDGEDVLYEAWIPFTSEPRPLAGWTQGVGSSIPPVVRSAAPALAERALREIFLHHSSPPIREEAP
jgi:hypothetical protein